MALCLLAAEWCRRQGGYLTALSVDHGLRAGSGDEARQVAAWLSARQIVQHILPWGGTKPTSGMQAAARDARYRLMESWCRDHHVLHLLVGHTADDQAETFLLRLQHGSGPDGLSGMSAVRELTHCRILRPLLGMRRTALRYYLGAQGQPWLDDPSNENPRFARTNVRQALAGGALSVGALSAAAGRYGQARIVAEDAADQFLARHGRLSPAGFMIFDGNVLNNAPQDTALRVLGRTLTAVGGGWYPPKRQPLEDLLARLGKDPAMSKTLGGCRIIAGAGGLLICREARNLPGPVQITDVTAFRWDGRILIKPDATAPRDLHIIAAGDARWSAAAVTGPAHEHWCRLPAPVRPSMPVLADRFGICAAPLLAYNKDRPGTMENIRKPAVSMTFAPRRGLSDPAFCVA